MLLAKRTTGSNFFKTMSTVNFTNIRTPKENYEKMLKGNEDWVNDTNSKAPDFFQDSTKGQQPHTMWIGCADSRVPANIITGCDSGEMFVHRNIANTVVHSDLNLLSVLQYAVEVLGVQHIIVCGHYGCGGVNAALSNKEFGLVDNWLRHIKDSYFVHKERLDAIEDKEELSRKAIEAHVEEGVLNICRTSIVKESWGRCKKAGKELTPQVHGWVYDIGTGNINPKVTRVGTKDVPLLIPNKFDW